MHDLQTGALDFVFMDGTFAAGQVRQEQLKALAVITSTRVAALPDVPTMKEAGLDFDFAPWWAAWAPSATPKPILDKLEAVFNEIAASDEHAKFATPLGNDAFVGNSTVLKELLAKDIKAWGEYAKLAKIEPI
jgi:tripartite-type tricarboxylate transporter receptor subunit TctC